MSNLNTVRGRLCAMLLGLLLAALVAASPARAQHQGHDMHDMPGMNKPKPSPSPSPSPSASPSSSPAATPAPSPEPSQEQTTPGVQQVSPAAQVPVTDTLKPGHTHEMHAPESMPGHDAKNLVSMTGSRMEIQLGGSTGNSINMGQMGSGTSWQPATSPMHMLMRTAGEWALFLHGEAKLGVNAQGGPRGATKFESQNWLMPMAFRRVGAGTLQLRGMFSLEPFTFPPGGSGQLFQSGETYKGRHLTDAQHPHDLFMELAAQYTVPLGESATWYAYFGYPGEPALGPVAFMHRASASENPSAPLAHHLQDSTHISFGVLTSGFTYRWLKLEGSIFNGREPDENRYNFEAHAWDSRSARVTVAPNENWAIQLSHAFLRHPESLEPGDVRRTTASVQYNRPFNRGNLAAAFIWGRNHGHHDVDAYNINGYTAEATVNFLDRNYLYTRLELVDRNELLSAEELDFLGIADEHSVFRIGAYTFGYVRDLMRRESFSLGVGGDTTFYSKPEVLDRLYGSKPVSTKLFLRFRLGGTMSGHGGHSMHDGMSGAQEGSGHETH